MALIGLIGGIAPESTIADYRLMVSGFRAHHPEQYPQILINSIDLSQMLSFVNVGDLPGLTAFLAPEVQRLAAAGATVAGFASNTPHLVFDAVAAQAPIPLVSIVQAAAEAAATGGYRAVALLGTRPTMEGSFYPDVFRRFRISVHTPPPEDRKYVHQVYFDELARGVFRPETREGLLQVIHRLQTAAPIDAVILGGTELPLILTSEVPSPVPLLDTAALHVAALLRAAGVTAA